MTQTDTKAMDKAHRTWCSFLWTAVKHNVSYRPLLCQMFGIESVDELRPHLGKRFAEADMRYLTLPLASLPESREALYEAMDEELARRQETSGWFCDESGNDCQIV